MATVQTPGALLRKALNEEQPLQLAGVVNAYAALLAGECGFRAIYLSGAGVANASFGLPDLGMTTLTDVLDDVRRITSASRLPVLAALRLRETGMRGSSSRTCFYFWCRR